MGSPQLKPTRAAQVVPISAKRAAGRFDGDEALVAGVRAADPLALDALVDRYGSYVERVLARVIGVDAELPDLVHDVFVSALDSFDSLRTPSLLKPWLRGVTVFVARGCLRRRRRRRWLSFRRDEDLPEVPTEHGFGLEADALRRLYRTLAKLSADEHIVFTLRFIEEMELAEVAAACRISVTTVKRRLHKAEAHFELEARKDPVLSERLERGARWAPS